MANRSNSRSFVVGSLLALAACSGGDKKEDTLANKGGSDTFGNQSVDPTLCDVSGKNIVTYDLNKDSKPDVWRLYKTEDENGTKVEWLTCKQVDFDHDGRKDWVVGFNRKGSRLVEKVDMDYDGKFDLSSVFDPKTGVVAEVERDRDFDGKYDLKEVYRTDGSLDSVRHDKNSDGKPDQWEQYKDGQLIAILYDDNYDGTVDRREEVPGARPKIEMPTVTEPGPAESDINADATGSGAAAGSGSAAKPK
jgi:hypothetical protein